METLSYNDRCAVTRATHETDRYDNPVVTEVYAGPCDFQPGGQTSQSIVTTDDVVYIPGAVDARPGDGISVRPRLSRERAGTVKLANVLELELTGDVVTEIEIKQGREI